MQKLSNFLLVHPTPNLIYYNTDSVDKRHWQSITKIKYDNMTVTVGANKMSTPRFDGVLPRQCIGGYPKQCTGDYPVNVWGTTPSMSLNYPG